MHLIPSVLLRPFRLPTVSPNSLSQGVVRARHAPSAAHVAMSNLALQLIVYYHAVFAFHLHGAFLTAHGTDAASFVARG